MAELRVKGTGTLKLFESDNTSSVTIASPASLGADRTVTLPDGDVTLVAGTMSTGGVALTGSTNNTVTTVTGADAIQGEADLTWDGVTLQLSGDTNEISAPSIRIIDDTDSRQAFITNNAGDLLIGTEDDDDTPNSLISIGNGELIIFKTANSERMRIESSGKTHIGTTIDGVYNDTTGVGGFNFVPTTHVAFAVNNARPLTLNRIDGDGDILWIYSDGLQVGTVSNSGSTVSYNAFAGSHWSRLADNSKPTILRGTVMESIATMMDWYQVKFTFNRDGEDIIKKESISLPDGKSVGDVVKHTYQGIEHDAEIIKESNEQLPMCKISDTADSKAVYGVFMDWDDKDDGLNGDVNDMLVTALGAFVVRIHKDETVAIGDYLQSKGDGTAKVQADDILRASTIGKVTSTEKTHIHADDSYCVPCTLHCG